jgi:YHS domain-containing protein
MLMAMKRLINSMLMLAVVSASAHAQTLYSCANKEVAFDGHDLVSYFESTPTKGNPEFTALYDGLRLQFCTEEHLDAFIQDPEKYMPLYGGWCATAMAQGVYNQPDFSMWDIQEGQLLFFEVKAFFNGKTQWMKDPDKHLILADRYYRISTAEEDEM